MGKIDVKKIVMGEIGASQKYEIDEKIDDLDFPKETTVKDVKGSLKIIRLEETLFVTGEFSSDVEIKCDRCLENFSKNVHFVIEREYEVNRLKESEENLFVDKYLKIDISEPVREELLMAVPMQNICDIECKGICQNCGENRNKKDCKCN